MRILYFCLQVDNKSQSLHFVVDWICALAEHDSVSKIDVVTMFAGDYQLPDCVRVYSVGRESGYSKARRAFEFYRILIRLLHKSSYGGCFAHMMPLFSLMGGPLLKAKRIPTVLWYAHGSVTPVLRGADKFVDAVFTPSDQSYRLKSRKKIVTGHGLNPESWPGYRPEKRLPEFRLVTVSRLSKVKNIDVILEAFCSYSELHPDDNTSLRIVGGSEEANDSYGTELQGLSQGLSCADRVTFCGSLDSRGVFDECERASLFLSASATGSIDKAVLESMACGVPVLVPACYKEVLPPDFYCLIHDGTPADICTKIAWFREHGSSLKPELLVDAIQKHHSLPVLMDRLVKYFGSREESRCSLIPCA